MTGTPRYAICGLSNRGISLFVMPLLGVGESDLSAHGELVAIVDVDRERVEQFNAQPTHASVPYYSPDEFDRMVTETEPDTILVTSPDYTHADYVVRALKHGIDVITEKPMAASCAQVQAIRRAEHESTASVRVTHNMRYQPRNRQIKRMLLDGLVGRVTSVDYLWSLDTYHGASYFYRWNRQRDYSGGLSIHKACHHFDLINWWLDDIPEQVFAYGARNYYGWDSPHNPSRRDGVDYTVAEQKQRCPYFRRWLSDGSLPADDHLTPRTGSQGLPYGVQYPPDHPIYLYDDQIDIEDTYSAVVRYRRGASMSYAVTFSGAWEGFRVGINGTHGRIETADYSFRQHAEAPPDSRTITYYPMFGERQVHDVAAAAGTHRGADPLIRHDLLVGPAPESQELAIAADSRQGAYAVAIGEGVWRSVRDNRPYTIAELLPAES
ncbi:MAG TPA: Gfo/Idh/MocA family oxidoreductase [Mycobacteriales bacterium]|nr:Gfo/Idh/MocA family oxidoreductase [Mycobacteriales bacterium]